MWRDARTVGIDESEIAPSYSLTLTWNCTFPGLQSAPMDDILAGCTTSQDTQRSLAWRRGQQGPKEGQGRGPDSNGLPQLAAC